MAIGRAERSPAAQVGQNVAVRKVVVGVISVVTAVAVAGVGADFGAAIYAEYRLARAVRGEAELNFDPWVGIIGFPFISQAAGRHYSQIEIRANGVDHPVAGKVSYEATLYSVGQSRLSMSGNCIDSMSGKAFSSSRYSLVASSIVPRSLVPGCVSVPMASRCQAVARSISTEAEACLQSFLPSYLCSALS